MSDEINQVEQTNTETPTYEFVVGVSFKKALQVYYFGTNDNTLTHG